MVILLCKANNESLHAFMNTEYLHWHFKKQSSTSKQTPSAGLTEQEWTQILGSNP